MIAKPPMEHAIALLKEWHRLSNMQMGIGDSFSWHTVELDRINALWAALPSEIRQAARVAERLTAK